MANNSNIKTHNYQMTSRDQGNHIKKTVLTHQHTPYFIKISFPLNLHRGSIMNAWWNNHSNTPLCLNLTGTITFSTLVSNYLSITTAFGTSSYLEVKKYHLHIAKEMEFTK